MAQQSWLLKLKCVLELAMAYSLGQASLAVPVVPPPVASATSPLSGECSLLSFLLGCEEDPTPYFPAWTLTGLVDLHCFLRRLLPAVS